MVSAALPSTEGTITQSFLLRASSSILTWATRQTTVHRTSAVSVVSGGSGAAFTRITVPTKHKSAGVVVSILVVSAINQPLLPVVRTTWIGTSYSVWSASLFPITLAKPVSVATTSTAWVVYRSAMSTVKLPMLVASCTVTRAILVSCVAKSAWLRCYKVPDGSRNTSWTFLRFAWRNAEIPWLLTVVLPGYATT